MSDSLGPYGVAHQAPLSMGFSRQDVWRGFSSPPPGDLPDSGIEPMSPALVGRLFTTELPEKPEDKLVTFKNFHKSFVVNVAIVVSVISNFTFYLHLNFSSKEKRTQPICLY